MSITSILRGVTLAAAVMVASSCKAQKPQLAEVAGQYTGQWELDVKSSSVQGVTDPMGRKELDDREWKVYGESFDVTSEGQHAIMVAFQGKKLKLDLKKIKSERDDGALEHEALLALDVTSVRGKTFSYKSADGALEVTFTIVKGKLEYESGVRVDSKFELSPKEFDGEYEVDCNGTFKGERVSFRAHLEIKFPQ